MFLRVKLAKNTRFMQLAFFHVKINLYRACEVSDRLPFSKRDHVNYPRTEIETQHGNIITITFTFENAAWGFIVWTAYLTT